MSFFTLEAIRRVCHSCEITDQPLEERQTADNACVTLTQSLGGARANELIYKCESLQKQDQFVSDLYFIPNNDMLVKKSKLMPNFDYQTF